MPNLSDPRVNTAQCVVVGHEGDADQPIVCPDWYNWRGIWIVVASIPFTIAFTWFALNWLERDRNHTEENLSKTLIFTSCGILVILPISEVIYISIRHIYITRDFSLSGILCHFILFLFSLLISFGIHVNQPNPRPVEDPLPLRKSRCGKFVVLPCIYQLVHHLLWVLCGGIPADPAWAIPLFLCECFVVLTLLCATYLYLKHKEARRHLEIFAFSILLGIFIVVISFYGCNVAVSLTDNLLVIIMAGALVWLFKNSDFGKIIGTDEEKGTGTDEEKGTGTDEEKGKRTDPNAHGTCEGESTGLMHTSTL